MYRAVILLQTRKACRVVSFRTLLLKARRYLNLIRCAGPPALGLPLALVPPALVVILGLLTLLPDPEIFLRPATVDVAAAFFFVFALARSAARRVFLAL